VNSCCYYWDRAWSPSRGTEGRPQVCNPAQSRRSAFGGARCRERCHQQRRAKTLRRNCKSSWETSHLYPQSLPTLRELH